MYIIIYTYCLVAVVTQILTVPQVEPVIEW